MSLEGQLFDQKSLRAVTGKTADWNEIAKDCIAFANATGGRLLLGIEDGQHAPPADQHVPSDLPDTLRRKLAQRTFNVSVLPDVVTASNGGQSSNCASRAPWPLPRPPMVATSCAWPTKASPSPVMT